MNLSHHLLNGAVVSADGLPLLTQADFPIVLVLLFQMCMLNKRWLDTHKHITGEDLLEEFEDPSGLFSTRPFFSQSLPERSHPHPLLREAASIEAEQ